MQIGMNSRLSIGHAGCVGSHQTTDIATKRVSLALVDIRLTGPIDGIELACLPRDRHQVAVIFLSGLVDDETVARAKAAKPLAFLAQPFRPSQVFNLIEHALRSSNTHAP